MKQFWFAIALFVCGISLVGFFAYWNSTGITSGATEIVFIDDPKADYQSAQDFLREGKPKEAIKVIKKYRTNIENNSEWGPKWLDLFVQASVQIPDVQQLLILYQYSPEAFEENEEASVLVAEDLLLKGQNEDFKAIREEWRGKETKLNRWLNIDADYFILEGKRDQAVALLKSQSFEGEKDVDRLLRLALLHVNDNSNEAWKYLSEGLKKDPDNAKVFSYRAKILETSGKDALALSEYIAASAADPKNPQIRDQLAEFFLRHKRYLQALQVYEESIENLKVTDSMLLKVVFWSKIVKPIDVDWQSVEISNGDLKPLIQYIINLKPWQYWDEKLFDKIPNNQQFLNTSQVLWWLRLISVLKNENDEVAKDLLAHNPFMDESWNPDLELALMRIINYRENKKLSLDVNDFEFSSLEESITEKSKTPIEFFQQLNEIAKKQEDDPNFVLPRDIEAILMDTNAFSVAFLAAGWSEVALELQKVKVIPKDAPQWVSYAYTQAVRENRGGSAALEYANLQHQTPVLDLLTAEIMLTQNNRDAAMLQLKKLQSDDDEVGLRASWLLGLAYLKEKKLEQARATIQENKLLMDNMLGVEALARIAMAEGDMSRADELYSSIEDSSAEAKSFLARKAYSDQDWERAKGLTIELLKEYPNSKVLRSNLIKIIDSQKKARME
ncbi:MAG: hypothetical protein VX777_07175 [Chlamydiota bacterium]|nr:hypothetical protein [Chlamydiota bacterium]